MQSARYAIIVMAACLLSVWHLQAIAQAEEEESETASAAEEVPQGDEPPVVPAAERGLELYPHPVYPSEQTELVFSPLADYLSEITSFEIRLVTVRDFHRYWLNVRRGEMPDLVIEDAHLTAWRMVNQDYTPLVRANRPQTYQLLVTDELADASLADFAGRRVSTMPSPSLGYMHLNSWFRDPLHRPSFMSGASSWEECADIIFSGEADAAIMPSELAELYPNLHSVRESDPVPGLTISISPEVDPQIHDTIRAALIVLHDQPHYFSALNELRVEQFVPAEPAEYQGLERMLDRLFGL